MANIAAHQAEQFGDTFVAERLSLAVEAARLGTWQWDIRTNRVLWSMELERIHGIPEGTFAGTLDASQSDIHPEDRERVSRTIEETVRERKPHRLEYRIVLPDGSTRWLESRGRMFFDEVGEPDRLVGVCLDITDRKRSEEALKQSEQNLRARAEELARVAHALERTNRELDAFAYAASHDLRAPLRGIANLAQWIEEDLQSQGKLPAETAEMLQLMRSRMHRMEALIEGLLQYSRAGRIHQAPEQVNTRKLVQDVVDLLAPADNVTVSISPDLPTVTASRLPLQQVFLNLIGNALKHANRDRAEVAISAADAGPSIEFAVKDNGPGIPPEFQDRIWGIFQTLEARDKVEGTGIGLALVKKLIDTAGGRVWVESKAGEGATFRFLWPKHPTVSGEAR